MAIPCNTLDLENKKFVECPEDSGQPAVRTKICQDEGETIKVIACNDTDNPLVVNPLNNILGGINFDSIEVTYPDSKTEVYTYYLGGIEGEIVATITASYYDSGKRKLKSVAKT